LSLLFCPKKKEIQEKNIKKERREIKNLSKERQANAISSLLTLGEEEGLFLCY